MAIERNPSKAREALEKALQIYEKALGTDHHLVSRVLHGLATICDSFGEFDESIKLHMRAIGITKKVIDIRILYLHCRCLVKGINNLEFHIKFWESPTN